MVMAMAREGSQEKSWLDASIQEREEAVQSILCLQCELGTSWMHGHDHECPKYKEKKTTRGEDAIQSIFCLRCALGPGSWKEGHDDRCPKLKNEKRATTKKTGASTTKKTGGASTTKKTGASAKTERKSRENKKRQTPSVVFTMTTVSKMSLMGAVTTTNTGVYHHPTPSIALDQYAVNSPRLAPLPHPSFYSSPLYMVPSNCCFDLPPFYCGKKLEYCNRKRRGRPPNCNFNCPAGQR
jgi:hypothetical protein